MSAQQNNPPSLQARRGRYRQSHCRCAGKTRHPDRNPILRNPARSGGARKHRSRVLSRERSKTQNCRRNIRRKPCNGWRNKKDLAAIGVTVPDVPKKLSPELPSKTFARTTPRAIPKERTPAVKKPSAVKGKTCREQICRNRPVKNVVEQPAQKLPKYVLRKRLRMRTRDCGSWVAA